jgi:hypothetical protein
LRNGVVLSVESEQERVDQRVARHASVFFEKATYLSPENPNLSSVENAAFGLRKILRDGQHEEDGISYFDSSEHGVAVLTYPGLVACAIDYIKSRDAAKNNAGRLLLEGFAHMAGADIDKAPEFVELLQTPGEKLAPTLRAQIKKIKKILEDEGYPLSPSRVICNRPFPLSVMKGLS